MENSTNLFKICLLDSLVLLLTSPVLQIKPLLVSHPSMLTTPPTSFMSPHLLLVINLISSVHWIISTKKAMLLHEFVLVVMKASITTAIENDLKF